MLLVLLSTIFLVVVGEGTTEPPTTTPHGTTTPYISPTPHIVGEYFRPYFFNDHPNLCGRVPRLQVYNSKARKWWDYYSHISDKPHMIYLAEARCGTCQSNAGVAGQLAKRWDTFKAHPRRLHQAADMGIFVFNRNHPADKAKYGMMVRQLQRRWSVSKYVTLLQDTDMSNVWGTLADYMVEGVGEHYNETRPFRSKKNDMYLVDRWGRMIRFLRDGILSRTRVNSGDGNIHWRDVVHQVMIAAGEQRTVCDELQHEWLYCRIPEDWELNGMSIRELRGGTSLTILVFIRADLEEYGVRGLLRDVIQLSKKWAAPNYVVIVDSSEASATSFSTANLYKQMHDDERRVTLLLDDENAVASRYFAAPGDLFATDYTGRIIGFFNRVDVTEPRVVDRLTELHLHWNPECEAFFEDIFTGSPTFTPPTRGSTGTPGTAPHFYSTSPYGHGA